MGLAHNTQRLICRVVLRGCCWLRNTRDSQLARGAAARLLCSRVCESGSVATARPCQPTGPCSIRPNFLALVCPFRELFLLLWCQATVCAWHCGPARVLPAARAAAATPRRVTSKVQSSVSCFSPKAKSRGDYRDRFFFVDFERIRFSAGLSRDASLGGARFFVFFFFFVLLSEDNHNHRRSRSPHVAVGVTRRLTLRKCLACASHRGRRFACTLPTDTDTVPTTEEPRFALSASPTRPSHAHMCKQQLGRPSDAPADPQPLFVMIRSTTRNTRTQHVQASTPPTTYLFVICESRPQTDI